MHASMTMARARQEHKYFVNNSTGAEDDLRIWELEDPEYTSASVTLFDPHADHQRSYLFSSSVADSQGSGLSLTSSPFPSGKSSTLVEFPIVGNNTQSLRIPLMALGL